MSKKPVILFIIFIVPMVLPFLFYHARQPAVIVTPQSAAETENEAVMTSNSSVLTQQSAEENRKNEKNTEYIVYAPGVTEEMQKPEYWLSKSENVGDILLSGEEIRQLNEQIINNGDLAYNIFSEDFRSRMETEIQYGISVSRTEIKEVPQEDPIGEDPYFDENLLTTERINMPVLVDGQTADGTYYHVICYDYQGWTLAENIALCSGLEEWEHFLSRSGWENFQKTGSGSSQSDILVVTVPRLRLEISGELLTMGTSMRLLTAEEAKGLLPEESIWGCYVVELAGRTKEGSFVPRYETIPVSEGVSVGFRDFTREDLLKQMFLFQGDCYGWGGSHESVDCSGLVQDVLASFGILMPRDAEEQSKIPVSRISFTASMDKIERKNILNVLGPGDILHFSGHIMFYLGQTGGEYYVLNAVSSMKNPQASSEEMLKVRSVIINTLSMERKNGNSWLDELDTAILF